MHYRESCTERAMRYELTPAMRKLDLVAPMADKAPPDLATVIANFSHAHPFPGGAEIPNSASSAMPSCAC